MKYTIKIDRNSIKKNPNAGFRGPYYVPGKTDCNADGSVSRNITPVYMINGEPEYSYDLIYPDITCQHCGSVSSYNELEDEEYVDDDDDYCISTNICPKCKTSDCCQIEFETLKDALKDNP